jgi:hypothetical protein
LVEISVFIIAENIYDNFLSETIVLIIFLYNHDTNFSPFLPIMKEEISMCLAMVVRNFHKIKIEAQRFSGR